MARGGLRWVLAVLAVASLSAWSAFAAPPLAAFGDNGGRAAIKSMLLAAVSKTPSLCTARCVPAALATLGESDALSSTQTVALCDAVGAALARAQAPSALPGDAALVALSAVESLPRLKCPGGSDPALQRAGVMAAAALAASPASLVELATAVVAAARLQSVHNLPLDSAAAAVAGGHVIHKVRALMSAEGTFSPNGNSGHSAAAAGLAYEALASAISLAGGTPPADVATAVAEVVAAMPRVITAAATAAAGGLLPASPAVGLTTPASSTSQLLRGAALLAAAVKSPAVVRVEAITALGGALAASSPGTPREASLLLSALAAVSNPSGGGPLPCPLAIRGTTTAIHAGSKPSFRVTVRTLDGKAVDGVKVIMTSLMGSGGAAAVITDPLTLLAVPGTPGVYEAPLGARASSPGHYVAEVTARGAEGVSGAASLKITVTVALAPTSAAIAVTSGGGDASVTVPWLQESPDRLTLDSGSELKVSVMPAYIPPSPKLALQLAMIRLSPVVGGGPAAHALLKPDGKGALAVKSTSAALAKSMGKKDIPPGSYALELVLGDSAVAAGVLWRLATITVAPVPAELVEHEPLKASHYTASKVPQAAQPDIVHVVRPPAARPPAVVSLLFTALALLPLAALLATLPSLGVNLRGWPTGGRGAIAAASFHASLAAVLALYGLYFWGLSLLQIAAPLAVLGLLTAVTGHVALRDSAERSAPKKKSE